MAGFSNADLKTMAGPYTAATFFIGQSNMLYLNPNPPTPGGGAGDTTPPATVVVSPLIANVAITTPIVFNTTDNLGQLVILTVSATFPTNGIEEVVYDNAAFGLKYQGGSSIKTSITNGFNFSILRNGGWPVGDSVVLTVLACDANGNVGLFSRTWGVGDITPPVLYSLAPLTATLVKVIYSEPVNTVDALVVGNYSINNGLQALSVSQVSPTTYLLKTTAQTPATVYTLTVTGVRDTSGNFI